MISVKNSCTFRNEYVALWHENLVLKGDQRGSTQSRQYLLNLEIRAFTPKSHNESCNTHYNIGTRLYALPIEESTFQKRTARCTCVNVQTTATAV